MNQACKRYLAEVSELETSESSSQQIALCRVQNSIASITDKTIAIIGAGIGGVAAALCLRQAGIRAVLFERRECLREAGAGLSLWPNGTSVLKQLGLLPLVLNAGQRGTNFRLRSPAGRTLMEIGTEHAGTPAVCLHRADLLRILAEGLPSQDLRLGQELTEIRPSKGKLLLQFANGETFLCDGLVGADGIHSQVRSMVAGSKDPQKRGYVIFRAIADAPADLVPGYNSETWGSGKRFGMLFLSQSKVCWYATSNTFDIQLAGEERKRRILRMFNSWHRPIQDLIEATDSTAILMSTARDLRPFRRWGFGATTLLGDAAHALTPNLGQGACMALEDAFVLANSLTAHANVEKAFRIYESLRFGRTRNAILRSRYLGWIGQWDSLMAVSLRNCVAGFLPGRLFECHATSKELLASITAGLFANVQLSTD